LYVAVSDPASCSKCQNANFSCHINFKDAVYLFILLH
jgi:hypothetical protein